MDNCNDRDYRTIRGYQNAKETAAISPAMEDYLEMIARLHKKNDDVRIGAISSALHVKPSSASKMVTKLKESEYIMMDLQGSIYLTAKGKKAADYLLYRHETIERFLTAIGSEKALEETEHIEHFLSPETIDSIEKILILLNRIS